MKNNYLRPLIKKDLNSQNIKFKKITFKIKNLRIILFI